MPSVTLNGVGRHFGALKAVDSVDLAVEHGEFVTLLGPSGCGKTTTLRMVAGLEHNDTGAITIGGRVVSDAAAGLFLPPDQRKLGMVFQSYAIWPHMTVFDNVAYGLRVRKRPAAEVKTRVREALDLVQLGELGERSASRLSGGQQQRVALARAFVFSPSVLLFDEPLSNLDAKLRAEMRVELKELQRRLDITSVYVTHDLEEARRSGPSAPSACASSARARRRPSTRGRRGSGSVCSRAISRSITWTGTAGSSSCAWPPPSL